MNKNIIDKIKRMMNHEMSQRFYWFDRLEVEFDPEGRTLWDEKSPLVTYIVYFKGGDYNFHKTWDDNASNPMNPDSQQSAFKYISNTHKMIFSDMDERVYYTTYSVLPNGESKSFPYILNSPYVIGENKTLIKIKRYINENQDGVDKYINYVARDLMSKIKFIRNESGDIIGIRLPGIEYYDVIHPGDISDEYHYLDFFGTGFNINKNTDDREFFNYIYNTYGMDKNILPHLVVRMDNLLKKYKNYGSRI